MNNALMTVARQLLAITVVGFCLLNLSAAEEGQTEQPQESSAEKLAASFSGEEAPDGLVFQHLARLIPHGFDSDPERTIRNVRRHMFPNDEQKVRLFVDALSNAVEQLDRVKLEAKVQYLCRADPSRTEAELYDDLNELTDVEIALAEIAYEEFLAELEEHEAERFKNWIQDAKQGFAYFVPSAEYHLSRSGKDAIQLYKEKCIGLEQSLATQ